MIERFITRQDRGAYSVIDTWTGEPAVIAQTPQSGLSEADARHTAELLNRRHERESAVSA